MYFVEKTKDNAFFKRFDYLIFIPVLLLSIIGLFVVRSAVLTRSDGGNKIMITQMIGFVLGMVLCFIIANVDYKDLKTLGYIFYSFSIVLLVIVLLAGFGQELGSKSWIRIGGLSFQPSEITKITFIIVTSIYFERLLDDTKGKEKNIFRLALFITIPLILVILQKDFGTTLVFFFILVMMLFAFGIQIRYLLITLGVFVASTPLIWFFVLNEARKERIRVFLDPERDPRGSGLNVLRSKMAIGSGRISGKGLFSGPQTQNSAVPVKESDFIFSVIGEELGFIGSMVIILLVSVLILRCIYISFFARDHFGTFLMVGISSMLGAHYIENIGMTIGLLPVTGIPLPFISQGGTSLITNLIAIGIAMSVSIRRKKSLFEH